MRIRDVMGWEYVTVVRMRVVGDDMAVCGGKDVLNVLHSIVERNGCVIWCQLSDMHSQAEKA